MAGERVGGDHGPMTTDLDVDLDRLYERFVAWGAAPTVDGYLDLFADDATLFDSGMAAPVPKAGIRALIEGTLALLDGFSFHPVRVGRNQRTLFVEAANSAVVNGTPVGWGAVYCMTAHGARVGRGRRYYDQAAFLSALTGGGPAPTEVPDPAAGPVSLTPGEVGRADDGWFREWSGTVTPAGTPVRFDAMERHAGGETVWYANSLVLRPAAAAAMAASLSAITGTGR